MKWTKLTLLAAFLAFTSFAFAQQTLPSVNIKTLTGETVDLQSFGENGKITVISLWATWCKPCNKELDAIAEYYEEWQEDYNMELVAITIDTQRAFAKVRPLVETHGWDFIILSDTNQQLKNVLNFQSIPQTYLVDQDGNIVYTHSGYVPGDEFELEDKIKELAGK